MVEYLLQERPQLTVDICQKPRVSDLHQVSGNVQIYFCFQILGMILQTLHQLINNQEQFAILKIKTLIYLEILAL